MTDALPPGLSGLTPEALAAWFDEGGEPAYRARQVADAVWRGQTGSVADIRTLPAALRARLEAAFRFDTVTDTEVREADGGLTEKMLHRDLVVDEWQIGTEQGPSKDRAVLSNPRRPSSTSFAMVRASNL